MGTTQIGTVDVLFPRTYSLDPTSTSNDGAAVLVQPGSYPVYSDGWSHYWLMTGKINHAGMHRLGDGAFTHHAGDWIDETSPDVTFMSGVFGPDEFADFLDNDPVCQPGAAQRLVFHVERPDEEKNEEGE